MKYDYVKIGTIVSSHGIKGELRLISDFPYKDRVFKKDQIVYVGRDKKKERINSYRRHKQYDMITLDNRNNINNIYVFLKSNVYVLQSDLELKDNEVIDEDLIGMSVIIDDEYHGKIIEIFKSSPTNKVIRFVRNGKSYLVPYVKNFIKNIDLKARKVILYSIEGVIECK